MAWSELHASGRVPDLPPAAQAGLQPNHAD
jgi:hypothetical protein